ncbi:MAG: YczE/YyaS/YitT family protein [Acidimicrobiia bacterium]
MLPVAVQLRRTPRLVVGLIVFGVGIAMIVLGDYGLPGWDVFHQGLSEKTPLSIGTAVIVVGAVLLLALLWLREPIGLGTIANVILIGLAMDATLYLIDDPANAWTRAALTLTGPLVVAIGTGLYLGVRLGPGPRDGLMTALNRRGVTLWKARFSVEAAALIAGYLMGGTVGWGTIWFLVAIGPTVQIALRFLSVPYLPDEPRVEKRPVKGARPTG